MWIYRTLLLLAYIIVEGHTQDPHVPSIEPDLIPSIAPEPIVPNVPVSTPSMAPVPPKNWTNLYCTMCQPGSFSTNLCGIPHDQTNNSAPICPQGQCLVKGMGLANCTLCSPGSHQRIPGTTRCVQCGPGLYSDIWGARYCSECTEGYYCPGLGNIRPKECDVGMYCPDDNMYQGLDCPVGFYCQTPCTVEPIMCEAGYFCKGSKFPREECPDHHYCEPGCIECPTECLMLFDSQRKASACEPTPLFYVIITLVVVFIVVIIAFIWKAAKKRIKEDMEHKQSMEITSLIPKAEGPKYTGL